MALIPQRELLDKLLGLNRNGDKPDAIITVCDRTAELGGTFLWMLSGIVTSCSHPPAVTRPCRTSATLACASTIC
jgi:hypothetical protein